MYCHNIDAVVPATTQMIKINGNNEFVNNKNTIQKSRNLRVVRSNTPSSKTIRKPINIQDILRSKLQLGKQFERSTLPMPCSVRAINKLKMQETQKLPYKCINFSPLKKSVKYTINR